MAFLGLKVGQLLDWSLPHWLSWFSGLPTGNWTALLALLDFWLAHGRSWNFFVFHNHLNQFLLNSCLYFSLCINPVCSVSLTNTDTIFKRFSFADRFPPFFFFKARVNSRKQFRNGWMIAYSCEFTLIWLIITCPNVCRQKQYVFQGCALKF